MSTPAPGEPTSEIKDLDYAQLRLTRVGEVESGFIRLVPAGTTGPVNTYMAEAHIDVDTDGNVIGVTWFAQR